MINQLSKHFGVSADVFEDMSTQEIEEQLGDFEKQREKLSKKRTKKQPTPTPQESDSEESESETELPEEGEEVVDIEKVSLADVMSGNKVGELAKVQKSILKCLGLLS